jgi:hypothetical protein
MPMVDAMALCQCRGLHRGALRSRCARCGPRNGSDLALEALGHTYGLLSDTPMVIPGGKGPHYDFVLDGPLGIFDPGPGLNLQADGTLVVALPSLHHSDNCDKWEASSHPDDEAMHLGIDAGLVLRTAITPPVWRGALCLARLAYCVWNSLRMYCARYLAGVIAVLDPAGALVRSRHSRGRPVDSLHVVARTRGLERDPAIRSHTNSGTVRCSNTRR